MSREGRGGREDRTDRWIGGLLRLLPAWFRERYGREMLATHREAIAMARAAGRLATLVYIARTTTDLIGNAISLRTGDRRGARVVRTTRAAVRARTGGFMDRLSQDVSFALRYLGRNPLYTMAVLATLALGIGMNTAAFSVLYGVVYQPLPYAEPDELVQVGRTHPNVANALLPLSPASFLDVRERAQRVRQLEVETGTGYVLAEGDEATRHPGSRVSAGFFALLGAAPALGRTFREGEDQAGAEKVVVLSDGLWRSGFGADPSIIGRTIDLSDTPHTVIGVMPASFRFARAELWTPFEWTDAARTARANNFLRMFARLAPGATVEQASADLSSVWAPLRAEFPEGNEDTDLAVMKLQDVVASANRTPLFIIAGAAGFLLLIACANVANLTLVRAEFRQREVGVRAAMGARPRQIARQFITESMVVALLGGLIGVAVAHVGVRALLAAFATAVPRAAEIGIHAPVLVFTIVASLVTGVLIGLVPALRMRADFDTLRSGVRGGARFTVVGKTLVVAEVALALMLVTAAGLLLKSYDRALRSELGFSAGDIVAANLWLPAARYTDTATGQALIDELLPLVEAQPGIEGVALSNMVPVREFGNNWTEVGAVGRPEAKASFVEGRAVSPDFFETLGMRLLRGRVATDAEARDGANVAVINQTLARQLFGTDDAIGERLLTGGGNEREIIGIVSDLRDFGPDQATRPTIYLPTSLTTTLILRTSAGTAAAADAVRAALRVTDPGVRLIRIQHMNEIVDTALSGRRFQLTLIGIFALTALLLASVGIYGVLSYAVTRQTREIGVRMALGAHATGVAGLIAWRGGRLAVAGIAFGLVGAVAVRRVIASQLFEVGTLDPVVYLGVTATLLAVAAAACYLPARRAASIEPTRALRAE